MKKKIGSGRIAPTIAFILFSIYALLLIYPILWAVMTSFKEQMDYNNHRLSLPEQWRMGNYAEAYKILKVGQNSMLTMLFNSVWYAGLGTFIGVAASCCTAYVVSKYRFNFRKVIYCIALVIMMLPIVGA